MHHKQISLAVHRRPLHIAPFGRHEALGFACYRHLVEPVFIAETSGVGVGDYKGDSDIIILCDEFSRLTVFERQVAFVRIAFADGYPKPAVFTGQHFGDFQFLYGKSICFQFFHLPVVFLQYVLVPYIYAVGLAINHHALSFYTAAVVQYHLVVEDIYHPSL